MDLAVLLEYAVPCWRGALTGPVPPNLIHSIYAVEFGGTRFSVSVEVARGSPKRGLEVNPGTELELEEDEPDPAATHQKDDGHYVVLRLPSLRMMLRKMPLQVPLSKRTCGQCQSATVRLRAPQPQHLQAKSRIGGQLSGRGGD